MNHKEILPEWAPRVKQWKIRRFYELDAQGIYDDELIDEVGYSLLSRCQSFIEAVEACSGQARCPVCGAMVPHTKHKDEILRCPCGWQLPWERYFRTIQHKQLSGAEPVLKQFRDYIAAFPRAGTWPEKVLLIDQLIHGFHLFIKTDRPTRPVAVNLIAGKLREVVNFLDSLSYSDKSTPGTKERYRAWDENIELNKAWYPGRRRKGEG